MLPPPSSFAVRGKILISRPPADEDRNSKRTDGWTDRQSERQTDRQAGRQPDRDTAAGRDRPHKRHKGMSYGLTGVKCSSYEYTWQADRQVVRAAALNI